MAGVMAQALAARGSRALVVRGPDGLDELTSGGPAQVWLVADGRVTEQEFDGRDAGLDVVTVADLRGGDASRNADALRDVVAGSPGPVLETAVLNAAAALLAAEGPRHDEPLAAQLAGPLARARAAVAGTGDVLERWLEAARAARSAHTPA
jgi:anthranilate phosphoribosyltransferase